MADKFLNDAEWQKFSKGRDLKEGPLLKALAAINKVRQPSEMPDALDEVEKQAEVLRKAGKGDKELIAFLDGLDKSLDKERKLTKAAIKEAEKESEDEEEESPVLLTTKMIPLMRQVKKGDEMQVMVGSMGKEVAVLISRRTISPTKRKLLAEYLGVTGGVKFILGTCIFEENAYTFVVQSQAAGLAKKIKAALLKQVELRLKVRVRGESPDDIDDDGEPAEDEALEAEGVSQSSQPQTQQAKTAEAQTGGAAAEDAERLKADFTKRLGAVTPTVMAALKAQGPDAGKVRALIEFAREKALAGNYKAGLAALDSLEKLLAALAPLAPTSTSGGTDAAAAFNARLAALLPKLKTAPANVKLKTAEAGALAGKKEFEPANALLDEIEALLAAPGTTATTTATGVDNAEEDDADETEAEEESGPDGADVQDRFKMISTQLKELAGLPEFAELKAGFDAATVLLNKQDWAAVVEQLDDIEPDIIAALSRARALAARPGGPSLMALGKASLAWRQASELAHREISALKGEMIASLVEEDELDEEELDEVRTELDRMDGIFQVISPRISDLVDTAINAGGDKRRKTLEQVMAMAKQAESAIQSDPMIAAIKSNGLRDVDLAGPAIQALTTLRDAMAPALAV